MLFLRGGGAYVIQSSGLAVGNAVFKAVEHGVQRVIVGHGQHVHADFGKAGQDAFGSIVIALALVAVANAAHRAFDIRHGIIGLAHRAGDHAEHIGEVIGTVGLQRRGEHVVIRADFAQEADGRGGRAGHGRGFRRGRGFGFRGFFDGFGGGAVGGQLHGRRAYRRGRGIRRNIGNGLGVRRENAGEIKDDSADYENHNDHQGDAQGGDAVIADADSRLLLAHEGAPPSRVG